MPLLFKLNSYRGLSSSMVTAVSYCLFLLIMRPTRHSQSTCSVRGKRSGTFCLPSSKIYSITRYRRAARLLHLQIRSISTRYYRWLSTDSRDPPSKASESARLPQHGTIPRHSKGTVCHFFPDRDYLLIPRRLALQPKHNEGFDSNPQNAAWNRLFQRSRRGPRARCLPDMPQQPRDARAPPREHDSQSLPQHRQADRLCLLL